MKVTQTCVRSYEIG